MADLRHSKHSAPRRSTRKRRTLSARTILPTLGMMAVVGAAGAAIFQGGSPVEAGAKALPDKDLFAASVSSGQAPATVSRSAERPPLPNAAEVEQQIEGIRYATGELKVYADAKSASPVLASVDFGDSVDITGETNGRWAQIIHKGVPRWVEAASISAEQPLGTAPCAGGSGTESGLQPDTIKVYRAVCAKFPSISRYGGSTGSGEHGTGQALDIMVPPEIGTQLAPFLQANRAKLGIEYLIYDQRIWRPATSPGWRSMSDRGSATANHKDHVHVTTYGNTATQ